MGIIVQGLGGGALVTQGYTRGAPAPGPTIPVATFVALARPLTR